MMLLRTLSPASFDNLEEISTDDYLYTTASNFELSLPAHLRKPLPISNVEKKNFGNKVPPQMNSSAV